MPANLPVRTSLAGASEDRDWVRPKTLALALLLTALIGDRSLALRLASRLLISTLTAFYVIETRLSLCSLNTTVT